MGVVRAVAKQTRRVRSRPHNPRSQFIEMILILPLFGIRGACYA
jgi:hypothetical protein